MRLRLQNYVKFQFRLHRLVILRTISVIYILISNRAVPFPLMGLFRQKHFREHVFDYGRRCFLVPNSSPKS